MAVQPWVALASAASQPLCGLWLGHPQPARVCFHQRPAEHYHAGLSLARAPTGGRPAEQYAIMLAGQLRAELEEPYACLHACLPPLELCRTLLRRD